MEQILKDFIDNNEAVDAYVTSKVTYISLEDVQTLLERQKEQLIIHGVSKSFKTELEMHEIATEKYHEHNYGDAKYDGFMECYRMLVKENKLNTELSK